MRPKSMKKTGTRIYTENHKTVFANWNLCQSRRDVVLGI